jgi:CRP/FNR family cyclic AMP-dependent transcriptional regulator
MSDLEKTVEFLAKVPLFANLNGRQLHSLARSVVEREYAAGEAIVTQGRGGIGLFIVVSGKAEAVRTRLDGTRTVVNTFGPTDFFGELTVLTEEPRTASVIAVDKVQCLVLSRWEFLAQLKLDVDMAIVIMEELVRRFQRALEVL